MAAHTQFMRKATLLIGNDAEARDLSALHFSFAIKQADLNFPQTATVRIYNVSSETAAKLKEYTRITIQAGYQQGAFGVVFDGEVVQAKFGRDNAVDTYVDILAAHGYSANQAGVSVTLAKGSTALDLARAAAAAMGLPLVSHIEEAPPPLPRGMTAYGMARDALSSAAQTLKAAWFYSSAGIELWPLTVANPGNITVINSATGMIGWPQQTQDGIAVRVLMNPSIGVGSTLQIDNASIQAATLSTGYTFINTLPTTDNDGYYRAYVVEHKGNTRGQEWYTDIISLSVDPANWGLSGLVQKAQL